MTRASLIFVSSCDRKRLDSIVTHH